MHKHLREKSGEEMFEETQREAETGPIMAVLQAFQSITLEVHIAIEIHFIECFHRDLALAMVLVAVTLAVEVEVVFNRAARVLSLLVLSRRDRRSGSPEDHQDGKSGKHSKEDRSVEATSHLSSAVPRDNNKK
jgi:hypothetical protein